MVGRFEQFCAAIVAIQRSIARIERMEMEKYGLKGPHAQCILMMGHSPEGITAAELCAACDKDKAAISRTLAELENEGMISRVDPNGKRYRSRLYLTERGRSVADQLDDQVHRAISQVSEGYDVETREIFVHVLNMIALNLQELSQSGIQERYTA